MSDFTVESIPDEDDLFYRIHEVNCRNGNIIPSAFYDIGSAMSLDRCKYSTPEDSKNRAKIPEKNGIVALKTKMVRAILLNVEHDPTNTNQSHSLVVGKKDPEIKLKLSRLALWKLPIKISDRSVL